jgi:hypothetical protein
MILLVIGLVAVIVVVLIAVFLSIRLGRGDEDDEPEMRPGGRDRRRDQAERWQERDTRRMPSPARSGAPCGRGGDGYGSRDGAGAGRELDSRGRGYDAARRPSRPEAPSYRRQPARPAVAASAPSRGRYDAPVRRHADDFPSADYPSMDFGPAGGYPADDHPSVDFPAVGPATPRSAGSGPATPRSAGSGPATPPMDSPRDSRRRAGAAPATSKGRARQRGKRDDDDDWPSSEWDKLSDEQYWAELSADKPLSSMARPAAKPARDPAGAAPVNGAAKPASRPARPPAPARDLRSRKDRMEREPVTERLPVRAASPQVPPPLDTSAAAVSRPYPEPHALLDSGPYRTSDTGPHPLHDTGPRAVRDTGPQPRPDHRRWDTAGPYAASDQDMTTLAPAPPPRPKLGRPASAPPPIPGALEDDPLTSPSFSLRAVPPSDSRSYSNARKHAKPIDQPVPHANGNGNGGYPAADPGYAYQSAPPAAMPSPAPAADWYGAPTVPAAESRTPAYGNPYQYPADGNGSSAGFADNQATAGYPGYLADPLRVYSPPGYAEPVPYPEPSAPAPYQSLPNGATMPYADGYSGHPYAEQAGYPDGYHAAGHAGPGYEDGYRADPYAAGGYGPYPPQG